MLQFKKISVNLALVVLLVGAASVQAENIEIPLPTEDPEIQAVVENVRAHIDVKDMMRQTRDSIKETQAKRLPLRLEMGEAISGIVSDRVRKETRAKTMSTQMGAMQDPANPDGVPDFIAPKFK